eukprot:snap_masked-scaffold_4-processed-gene-10.8-mRNA-1 protein AED:1.00 eAED:1.00 QI:0/-1/0/0/-1/1/1/0/148
MIDANNFDGNRLVKTDDGYVIEKVPPVYCKIWFDGCNTCEREEPAKSSTETMENFVCTEKFCEETDLKEKKCLEYFPDRPRNSVSESVNNHKYVGIQELEAINPIPLMYSKTESDESSVSFYAIVGVLVAALAFMVFMVNQLRKKNYG